MVFSILEKTPIRFYMACILRLYLQLCLSGIQIGDTIQTSIGNHICQSIGTTIKYMYMVYRRPQGFRSLSQRVLIRSLSNLVNLLMCIMSKPISITSQIPQTLLNYGPFIVQTQGFRPLSQRVFVLSLSTLVNMLVGIMSRPSSITCQIPHVLLNYGP